MSILRAASAGLNLLWGKDWKNLPLSRERVNTIFGFLLASWLLLFLPMLRTPEPCFAVFPLAYTIFLLVIYWRTRQKLAEAEEMFP